jgi:uncharacterized protein YqeY
MSLETKITEGIKAAMLAKDTARLEALRGIKAAILIDKTKDGSAELAADAEMKLLQKLVKQRRESATIYAQNNRPELAAKENVEADCIEEFLPKQLSREEIVAAAQDIIAQAGAVSAKDFGKIMGIASKHFAGKADGKMVADIIKSLLPQV